MSLRRHLVSSILVALALALAGYLVLVDGARRPGEANGELDDRGHDPHGDHPRALLPAFPREHVRAIDLARPHVTVHIERRSVDGGEVTDWLGDEAADPSAVDHLLGVLASAIWERRLSGEVDRAALGLTEPRARLTLTMSSGAASPIELALGGAAPTPPGAAYLEVVGRGVYVVGRDLVTELTRPEGVYRERALLPFALAEVSALSFSRGTGGYALTRGAWGGLAVTHRGEAVRADRAATERVLGALAELRAESFVTLAQAEASLADDPDRARLVVSGRAAGGPAAPSSFVPRVTLELGGTCPGASGSALAVRREPLPIEAACIGAGVVASLALSEDELVDRHLFALHRDDVEQIQLASAPGALELVRVGTGWHVRAPAEGAVDHEIGQAIAVSLLGLVATELATPPLRHDAGAAPAAATALRGHAELTATQVAAGPGAIERLEWSDPDDRWLVVHRLQDGAWLQVPRAMAEVLEPNPLVLRGLRVVEVAADKVERVTVTSATVRQTLTRSAAGSYALDEPKGYALDPGLALDLVETLTQLRAQRWVKARALPAHGLDAPSAVCELIAEGETVRIELGRPADDGVYARRAGDDAVFVLARAAQRTLATWAIDRSSLMLDAARVRALTAARGARRTVLLGAGAPADAGAPGAEKLATVLQALSEARAEAVVHLGPARPEDGMAAPELHITAELEGAPGYGIRIGRAGFFQGARVYYARRDGIDATFALAEGKVRALFAALAVEPR